MYTHCPVCAPAYMARTFSRHLRQKAGAVMNRMKIRRLPSVRASLAAAPPGGPVPPDPDGYSSGPVHIYPVLPRWRRPALRQHRHCDPHFGGIHFRLFSQCQLRCPRPAGTKRPILFTRSSGSAVGTYSRQRCPPPKARSASPPIPLPRKPGVSRHKETAPPQDRPDAAGLRCW